MKNKARIKETIKNPGEFRRLVETALRLEEEKLARFSQKGFLLELLSRGISGSSHKSGQEVKAFLDEYLSQGLTMDLKSALLAFVKRPGVKKGDMATSLAHFILLAGHLQKEELFFALAHYQDMEEADNPLLVALKSVAGSILTLALASLDRTKEAREILDSMSRQSWEPQETGGRLAPLRPLTLELTRFGSNEKKGKERPLIRQNPAPFLTLVPSREEVPKGPSENDLTMAKELLEVFQLKSPRDAWCRTAANLIVAYGITFSHEEGRDLYDLIMDEYGWRGIPSLQDKLLRSHIYASSFCPGGQRALEHLRELDYKVSGAWKVHPTAVLTMLKQAAERGKAQEAEDLLEYLKAIDYGDTPSDPYLARGYSILILHYLAVCDTFKVKELYNQMASLSECHEVLIARFHISIDIIVAYAMGGELSFSLDLFNRLEYLYDYPEFHPFLARAALSLAVAFTYFGMLENAREFYDLQLKFQVDSCDVSPYLNSDPFCFKLASLDLASCLETDLYHNFTGTKYLSNVKEGRYLAASMLLDAYSKNKDMEGAAEIYSSIPLEEIGEKVGLKEEVKSTYTPMACVLSYFNACINNSQLEKAEEIFYQDSLKLGHYDIIQEKRSGMLCAIILKYHELGESEKAEKIFRDVILNNSTHLSKEASVRVCSMMVHFLAQTDSVELAEKIYYLPNFQTDSLLYLNHRSRAAMGLAYAYLLLDETEKAYKLYQDDNFHEVFPEDKEVKLEVISIMASKYIKNGKTHIARHLVECMPEIPKSELAAHFRISTVLELQEIYQAQENEEGKEFTRNFFSKLNPLEKRIFKELYQESGPEAETVIN